MVPCELIMGLDRNGSIAYCEKPKKVEKNSQMYCNVLEKFYGFNQCPIALSKFYPIDSSNMFEVEQGL